MSDTEVSSIDPMECTSQEPANFTLPITRVGINNFFNRFSKEFVSTCEQHQAILTQYHVMLTCKETGSYPRDARRISSDFSSHEHQLAQTSDYATKLFKQKVRQAGEKYLERHLSNLDWQFNGSRESFVRWVARYYLGSPVHPPKYEELQNIFGKRELEDSEKYFHLRANTFQTNIYIPNTEKITALVLALCATELIS